MQEARQEDAPQEDVPYENASPLALAVWRNQGSKVRKLLRDGADVNQRGPQLGKGNHGDNPIHLAIKKVRHWHNISCHCHWYHMPHPLR